jgi:hypothetical protein
MPRVDQRRSSTGHFFDALARTRDRRLGLARPVCQRQSHTRASGKWQVAKYNLPLAPPALQRLPG